MILFHGINLPSDEPVQFVGVHPLKWHRHPAEPDMAFTPLEEKEVVLGKISTHWVWDVGECAHQHHVVGSFEGLVGTIPLAEVFETALGDLKAGKIVTAAIYDGMLIFRLEEREEPKPTAELATEVEGEWP